MSLWQMTFLHPWAALAAVAAIALPIAVHFLTRPRPLRMPLSTLRFVRQAVQQKRARYRLRDILVLLLRALAVCLFGLAFARPMMAARPAIDTKAAGGVMRVIVLDNSMGMAAVSGGSTAMEKARFSAAQYLRFQQGLRADLIIAAARPMPVFEQVSLNIGALRDALKSAEPQPQRMDAQSAINRAAQLLSSSPQASDVRQEVVIISDFQRSNWTSVDFSPLPKDAQILLESVAPAQTPDNFAITRVGAKGQLEQGREFRLETDVANFSPAARGVQVEVSLGAGVYQLTGTCPPGVTTTLSSVVKLPDVPGWITGHAKLVGVSDSLAMDNSRSVALEVRPLPTYALITRESSKPHASSSHFLERALVPTVPRAGVPSEQVVRIDPANLDRQVIGAAALLVLDHPGNLSDDSINLLATLVRRGKGMLYVAADPTDASNLERFSRVLGSDLKMPVQFLPSAAGQTRHDLFLLDWRHDQAPFDQLGDTMSAIAGSLRFSRGLASRQLPDGLADDVLAIFSDRSACLVATPCGAGTLAVLNADLMASNLSSSPLFVPLISELTGRLMAANGSADAQNCGEPMAIYLPLDAGSAKGLAISGQESESADMGTLSDDSTGVLWRSNAAANSGAYQVKRDDRIVFAMATASPASQSDLQSIDPSILTTRLAAGRNVAFHTAGDLPPQDIAWSWLLVGCAVCLIGELGVLKLFRT